MSFMDFGAEDLDVADDALIVPEKTTYRRRTMAEFKAELEKWLTEMEAGEKQP